MKHPAKPLSLLLICSFLISSSACSAKSEPSITQDTTSGTSESVAGSETASTEGSTTASNTDATTTTAAATTTTTEATEPPHETEPYSSSVMKKKPACAMDPIKIDQYCYKNNVENAGTKYAFVKDANMGSTTINGTVFSKQEICITDYKPTKDYDSYSGSFNNTYEFLAMPSLYCLSLGKSGWGDQTDFYMKVWDDYFLSAKSIKDASVYFQRCDSDNMHTYTEFRALKFKNTIYSQYFYRMITDPLKYQKSWFEISAVDYNVQYALAGATKELQKEECRFNTKEKKNKYYMMSLTAPCMPGADFRGTFELSVAVYKKDQYVLIVTDWVHFDKGDIMDFYTKDGVDFPSSIICKELGLNPPCDLIKDESSIGTIVPED